MRKDATIRSITDVPRAPGFPTDTIVEYPDRDRFEVIHTKDVFLLFGQVGNVKVKNKSDLVLIHNGDKGYEVTYKGTAAQDKPDLENYLRRREHSLEWVFRKWMRDPDVALFYDGAAVVDGKETEGVTLLNSLNDFGQRFPGSQFALSGQDQLLVARSQGQAEKCGRRDLRQLQTGAGNLDPALHYPLFQRRDFAAALHQHRELQPEAAGFNVRSGGDVRPHSTAEEPVKASGRI